MLRMAVCDDDRVITTDEMENTYHGLTILYQIVRDGSFVSLLFSPALYPAFMLPGHFVVVDTDKEQVAHRFI